jgi:hypothetical protein
LVPDFVILGGLLRPFGGWKEEGAVGILAEVVDQDAKASLRVPESFGGLLVAQALDEIGAKGFVLSMGGVGGLEEEGGYIS